MSNSDSESSNSVDENEVIFQAFKWEIDPTADNETIIFIHGLTEDNKKVSIKIPDFKPHVYLELDSNIVWTKNKVQFIDTFLRKTLHQNYPVSLKKVTRKKNYYYKEADFLHLRFNTVDGIKALERIVSKKLMIHGIGQIKLTLHEQRADPVLQLFAIQKVKPAGWIIAQKCKKVNIIQQHGGKFSSSDIQMVSSYKQIAGITSTKVTNPLVMSYDIECISGDSSGNTFPNAKLQSDQIVCISATIANIQETDETKWKVYCLVSEVGNRKCPNDLNDGSIILHFSNEKALLIGWTEFVKKHDPDIITGYNTLSFDDKYIIGRANALRCWTSFSKIGRLMGKKAKICERKWGSSAYGDQQFNYIDISGRLHLDMYPIIFRDYGNLSSYTLDSVSEEFLKDKKIDLPAPEMIKMWHQGGTDNIAKIVQYCNKDTQLPLKLMQKLNTWLGLTEMANVMMVQVFDLITRGQQIRVFSQIYTLCHELKIVTTDRWADYQPTDDEKQFVGATVQNPMAGYHELVATYDFCLTGDTLVSLSNGTSKRIDELTHDSQVLGWSSENNGFDNFTTINGLQEKGKKSTIKLTLEYGKTITCTPDHKFMLENGKWEMAKNLQNKYIKCGVEFPQCPSDLTQNDIIKYRIANYLDTTQKVVFNTLYDATMYKNDIKLILNTNVNISKNNDKYIIFISDIHIKKIKQWNIINISHIKLYKYNILDFNCSIDQDSLILPSFKQKVIDITDAGIQPVYDIEVKKCHNFVANGIVAHNCSLYPTTIIAYNLCFSTFIHNDEKGISKDDYHDLQFESHSGCEHDTAIRKTKVPKNKIICGNHHYKFYKASVKKGIIPMLLEDLLDARSNTKKEMKQIAEKLKNPKLSKKKIAELQLLKNVLDKRQAGYKVSANSVTGDTPIPCLINGVFSYLPIEELGTKWTWDHSGNQVSKPIDVKVWSDSGWTPVKWIFRHHLQNTLVRVCTNTGIVDCTDQHSLLNSKGNPIKPVDIGNNTELMQHDLPLPADTPTTPTDLNILHIEKSKLDTTFFIYGLFFAGGHINIDENNQEQLVFNISFREEHYQLLTDVFNWLGEPLITFQEKKAIYTITNIDIIKHYHNLFYTYRGEKKVPDIIYTGTLSQRKSFAVSAQWINNWCYYGQSAAAGMYHLFKTLGYNTTFVEIENSYHFKIGQKSPLVTEIAAISNDSREWVYDLETESHHFAAGCGNLIVHNSMYGGFGSDYSYTPFYPAAASTTAMGRKSIQDAIDFAKNYRKDTVLVYGDSVTADTPILLKSKNEIYIKEISDINKNQWENYKDFKPNFLEPIKSSIEYYSAENGPEQLLAARKMFNETSNSNKQHSIFKDGQLMVWTDIGWSNIKQIIRHKTAKQIYRITTTMGIVDVTQDHSLLTPDLQQIKPSDLNIGDELLHSPIPRNKNWNSNTFDTPIVSETKLKTQQLWYGMWNLGYNCTFQTPTFDSPYYKIIPTDPCNLTNKITKIEQLGCTTDFVYDLETDCGRFQAGIGSVIVKNTDSCMLKFSKVKKLKECFKICEEMEEEINEIFPKPMKLELEKIYSKYFLLSKKRYVGYIVDSNGNLLSTDKKGVVIKRRDNCGYLRDTYTILIDLVMDKAPKWEIYDFIAKQVDCLLEGKVDVEKLVITKSIKENYKAQNLPHVAVSKKMKSRGKYVATGTRIRYIFIETASKNDPQYIKAEDPDFYLQSNGKIKIDYLYYLEKQIVNPLDEVLEVKYNTPNILQNFLKLLKKNRIKTAKEYFSPKFKIQK